MIKPRDGTHTLDEFALQDVFSLLNGASISAMKVDVSGSAVQTSVYNVNRAGATLTDCSISNVNMAGTQALWTGINATNGASITVSNTTFANDQQMLGCIVAQGQGTTVSVDRVNITNVAGSLGAVSDFAT